VDVVTVYGMARQKTTVYLDSGDYRRLKAIARAQGRAPAELVREAVAEYTVREEPRRRPRSIGAGRSRTGTVARRAEALLAAGFGRER
jgi:predicted transcriptional regulator